VRFDASIFTVPRNETPGHLRVAGAILLILGLIIVIGGGALALLLFGIRIPAEWLPEGTRIEGTPGDGLSKLQRVGSWAVTLLLLTCGIAAILQGFWQLFLGRKNKMLLRIIIAAAVVIVAGGVVASIHEGCPIGRICQ
jgi:MFS family permease